MSRPPSRLFTLLAFWAAGNVSLAPFLQVICAKTAPASQALNFLQAGARWFQWRTYPLTLALEDNALDVVIGEPVGPACLAVLLALFIACPACGR